MVDVVRVRTWPRECQIEGGLAMFYLYYMMVAVSGVLPFAVPLVFVGAVFVQQTSAFWLNRPLGQRRTVPLPERPRADASARFAGRNDRLQRWHIAAVVVVVTPPVMATAAYALSANEIAGCRPDELYGCFATGALTEVMLAFLMGSIVFALIYLNALDRHGVSNAALIAFGVWAVPRSLLLLTPQFSETHYLAFDVAMVVGVLIFGAALWLRSGTWRTVAMGISCALMTVGLVSAAMSNGVLFVVDGMLSATAIGYGIYQINRRRSVNLGGFLRHIRPFLLALTWPVLMLLLAAGPGQLGSEELGWMPRLAGGALTVTLLWAMWYIVGPGRQPAREDQAAADSHTNPQGATPAGELNR